MRIIPLGGAHEVGASSTIVEFGAHRVLVDAGIRIGEKGGDRLPDLARIQDEAGNIDAIFLTHAHMDHSGALPLVHLAFPNAPIYMTPATYAVVRILFEDGLRLMEGQYEREGEIPLYPPAAVESCLGCIRPTPFDYPLRVSGGEISATFHPAGHILGASSIHFQGRSGTVLVSGDISVTDQRTVPGMLPPQVEPDVIIVESTYGNRLHPNRTSQENNLVRTVCDVIESGGKVIIPAFAVGRAQEVILILRHAISLGLLPSFPIFVDGMVRSVCDTYSRFPTYLQRHLRRSVQQGEHPFFPSGGPVHRVRSQHQRQQILSGPPCCIVASSGMMTGGPSAFYAAALASDAKSLIAITGYQDEEAPGRRLLDLADAPVGERRLLFNGEETRIDCRVEKYSLSAHADSGEITGLLGHMAPSQGVVLVHGDREAREALATTIDGMLHCDVFLPGNGEDLNFQSSSKVLFTPPVGPPKSSKAHPQIGLPHQPLDKGTFSHIHQALWAETGRRGLFRVADLYARWYGPNQLPSGEELDVLQLLVDGLPYFVPDRRRPHLYRLRSPHEIFGKKESASTSSQPSGLMEMNMALQKISQCFPADSGLYKKGSRQDERTLLLFFRFPDVAKLRFDAQIKQLEEETGWKVVLNEMPHHAALEELARRILPEEWELFRNPSILHESQAVRLRVLSPPALSTAAFEKECVRICLQFQEETGYQLEIVGVQTAEPVELELPLSPSPQATLEINLAYQMIDEFFGQFSDRPYKKSKKGDGIVLSFLSPIVGARYENELEELARNIGWPISINPEPNQYGIKQEVRTLLPENWGLSKEPGVFKRRSVVRIALHNTPKRAELEQFAKKVYDRTGFQLEIAESS